MRTAVIGCSHSAGYQFPAPDGIRDRWNDNNWAEVYINNQNKDGVIFACPGRGWYDYSERLAFLFKKYDDIDEVVIQQTYWNRYRLGFSNPCYYENIIPLDAHMMQEETKGRIDCYNINMWNDELKSFDGGRITMSGDYAIQPTLSMKFDPFDLIEPNLQQEGYQRVKAWYEVMTVVNQRQFFKEVYLWNQMCKENNAVLKIFAINDQTWLPKDLNIIGNVQADVSEKTATQFLLTKGELQDFVVDDEHFNLEAHTLIANEYIPNMKGSLC
jgi:hypothetical protein